MSFRQWSRLFRKQEKPLFFYNTLSSKKERFALPKLVSTVRMYNCGPTVYGKQHIGNLSMFVFTDVLRRTLEWNGFKVLQVINITDVGHLQSDADAGEDKMTLGLQREGLELTLSNMKLLAERYANIFFEDLSLLNIDVKRIQFPRASDHISADIAMIKTLEEKGYAYATADGVYYDTSRFPEYGKLGNIDLSGLKEGARVAYSTAKKNPTDFLLWKFDSTLGWDSPWGMGFPGWHIECSAMIRDCLGQQIDIHTGGIEHIPVHHNNEIAQSEIATGRSPLSRFWMHRSHIQIEGGKIAKSQGNVVYLSDVIERGYHPMALRYLFLQAHYRSNANFSWEGLQSAQNALSNLLNLTAKSSENVESAQQWIEAFTARVNDDLDTPGALAVLWDMTKDKTLTDAQVAATLLRMDKILGLNLGSPDISAKRLIKEEIQKSDLPATVAQLLSQREEARSKKNWTLSDSLRTQILKEGFIVEDFEGNTRIFRAQKFTS